MRYKKKDEFITAKRFVGQDDATNRLGIVPTGELNEYALIIDGKSTPVFPMDFIVTHSDGTKEVMTTERFFSIYEAVDAGAEAVVE